MDQGEIGLGVIGCGGFGLYALQQFAQVPGVRLAGWPGRIGRRRRRGAAVRHPRHRGRRHDAGAGRRRPGLHRHSAVPAPSAGHGGVPGRQARDLREAAGDDGRAGRRDDRRRAPERPPARRQPDAAVQPRHRRGRPADREQVLGELLHGTFENYASDENLGPGALVLGPVEERRHLHRARRPLLRSLRGLARPGRRGGRPARAAAGSVAADRRARPVHGPLRPTALVNFYHGFHQTGRMDRQELRLVFERGDVTLYDWVPTRVRVHAIADEAQTRALCELFPGARLDVTVAYGPKDRACEGRHKTLDVYQMLELAWGEGIQQVAPLRRAAPRRCCPTSSPGFATIPTRGRSPRPTAAIRWPSPARPTGWPRLELADLDGGCPETAAETRHRVRDQVSERIHAAQTLYETCSRPDIALARGFRGRRGLQSRGDAVQGRGDLTRPGRGAAPPASPRIHGLPRWAPGEGLAMDWVPTTSSSRSIPGW